MGYAPPGLLLCVCMCVQLYNNGTKERKKKNNVGGDCVVHGQKQVTKAGNLDKRSTGPIFFFFFFTYTHFFNSRLRRACTSAAV